LSWPSLEGRPAQATAPPLTNAAETETTLSELVCLDLKHSRDVYQTRGLFPPFGPYVWRYPREAWAALREVFPWEAVALSLFAGAIVWSAYGSDLGTSMSMCLALGLGTIQMFRTRSFATASALVQQRGLFFLARRVTPLSVVHAGRVVYAGGLPDTFGDVVLETPAGAVRLRAIHSPETVLAQLMRLRDLASAHGHDAGTV
jgi:hypothetical protein